MYVCICNAVSERTIRELVAEGYHSLNEIQALTGCSGTCGHCREHAESVIESSLAGQARPALPVPASPGKTSLLPVA